MPRQPTRRRARHWRYVARDALRNLVRCRAPRRFLVLRDSGHQPSHNDHFLAYLARTRPAARALFELRRLPCRIRDWEPYALVVPWLQDPLRERFPSVYGQARAVERAATAHGVPVVSPVDTLSAAIKSVALPIIRSTGARTAAVVPIADAAVRKPPAGLTFPFLLREDHEHSGEILRIDDAAALRRAPLARFARPLAMEYVDVRSPDGRYRKYRYLLVGAAGVPRHLIVSDHWLVRARDRVRSPAVLREELAYLEAPDPNHDLLRRAQQALGHEVVAFDYSYDRDGRLVVWEPNPFANLWQDFNRDPYYAYQEPYLARIYDVLLRHYLRRSTLDAATRARVMPDDDAGT
jgi:hypothetical protein